MKMAQQDRTMSASNGVPKSMANSTATQSLSPIRNRQLGRASTFAEPSHPLRQRRSSTFSESVDSTRQSIKSSTDDLLLPRARSADLHPSHEPSHWHSVPLALAFFPALGGLFIKDGSAIITDLTLLVLAAIFLNWAVRLPWDWYLSARAIRIEASQPYYNDYPTDTIIEEGSEEEENLSQPPSPNADNKDKDKESKTPDPSSSQATAAAELRVHESLAFLGCFVFPAAGTWLLHQIRAQLSRPSEGLVSNYNLTIFLLASELRPFSHLLKMIQARTLHLQRIVATSPHSPSADGISSSALQDLQNRLGELENHVAETTSNGSAIKIPPAELTTQIRKSIQPDLEALNRAVRRYEKRATLLTMQTESRLQELEKRMGDAITLAAAAERSSQNNRQRRGSGVSLMVDWVATMAMLPIQIAWSVISLPGRVISGIWDQVLGYLGQKYQKEMRTAGRAESSVGSGSERRKAAGRGQKKAS